MSTFQERFSRAFDVEVRRRLDEGEPRLTKTMVWKAANATSGAFTQWYDGTTGAKLSTCFLIAPLLRVNPHWLFDESQEKNFNQPHQEPTRIDTPLPVVTLKPATERERAIAGLMAVVDRLEISGIFKLTERATMLQAEQPAKQTPRSSA